MTNMKNIVYLSAASLFILISLTYLATTPIWPFNKEDMFAQCRNSKVTGGTASIGGTIELVAADGSTVSDIEIFLQMRKNHGEEDLKARDLFYALWTPDLFMERVKANGDWTLM